MIDYSRITKRDLYEMEQKEQQKRYQDIVSSLQKVGVKVDEYDLDKPNFYSRKRRLQWAS